MTNPDICNLAGLVMNLIGVVLLFFYVMPRRVRTGGHDMYVGSQHDQKALRAEQRFDLFSYIGLGLVVSGTVLQMTAIWLSKH
jgi:hypothetical protein